MITEIAEFRIRIPDTSWEDTPAISMLTTKSMSKGSCRIQAHDHAKAIASLVKREVRWNWQGSPQGHYVGSVYRLPRPQQSYP